MMIAPNVVWMPLESRSEIICILHKAFDWWTNVCDSKLRVIPLSKRHRFSSVVLFGDAKGDSF